MDSGGWALIGVALLGLVGTLYAARQTSKSNADQTKVQADQTKVQADGNDISEFEANIRAFDLRARNAETRADELLARVEALERKDSERDRQLNRIRLIVQTWFRELYAAWSDSTPMPLPTEEDLDLLGITIPRIPKDRSTT